MSIRFGADDVVAHQLGDFVLVLDGADRAVSRPILDGNDYEPHVEAVFRRYCAPGMVVADIGANIGYYSMLAARLVGPRGRVVAIEPNSENCRLIVMSSRANGFSNVEVWPIALDEEQGWSYFSAHIGSNGGLIPGDDDDLGDGRGLVVPTFPFDELFDGPLGLVKIDVEGAEGRVVAGAQKLISTHRPVIITELSLEMLPRVSGTSASDYLGWFENIGYSVAVINRSTCRVDPPTTSTVLVESWGDPHRIEDLLLIPPSQA